MYATMFHDFCNGVQNMEHLVNKYKSILQDFYYLDSQGKLRYKKEGYLGRYKKDELVRSRVDTNGYNAITLPLIRNKSNGGIQVRVFNVIWVIAGKELPDDKELDHINGIRTDDRLENLRLVTRTINCKNRKKRSDNTSGITGICWNKSHKSWCIRRTVKGTRLFAYRKTLEEAKQALEEFTKLDPDYTKRHGK